MTGLALVTVAILAVSPNIGQAAPASATTIAAGRAIVQRDCSACHAIGKTGASRNPAAPHFRDLGRRYDLDDLSEALAEGILVGHSPMPVRTYPPDQVKAIIAYLKSLSPKP